MTKRHWFVDVFLVLCVIAVVFVCVAMPGFERAKIMDDISELKSDIQELKQLLSDP